MTKQPIKQILKQHNVARLIAALIIFWAPIVLFSTLAGEVMEKESIYFDAVLLRWIHAFSTPFLDNLFLFFTSLGNTIFVATVAVIAIGYLLYKKQHAHMFLLLFGVGGAALSNVVLKLMFQRDRPALWDQLITETSYSFPSGHAMVSGAFIICLIVMTWRTRWRLPVLIAGGVVMGMIGLSRVYLGVHYPTDVAAGWLASSIWIMIVVRCLRLFQDSYMIKHVR